MARNLQEYLEENRALRQAVGSGTIRTIQDLIQWHQTTESYTSDFDFTRAVLQESGFADDEINEWCFSALENLMAGRKALPRGVLFTRDWVISRLRTWRAKNQLWFIREQKASHRIPNS
jgi:hypothetical protein